MLCRGGVAADGRRRHGGLPLGNGIRAADDAARRVRCERAGSEGVRHTSSWPSAMTALVAAGNHEYSSTEAPAAFSKSSEAFRARACGLQHEFGRWVLIAALGWPVLDRRTTPAEDCSRHRMLDIGSYAEIPSYET